MPSKHQPDFSYLRHVPLRKVHLFTLVQIACLAVLWILKSTFLAIIFPVMVRKRQIEPPVRKYAETFQLCVFHNHHSG